MNVELLPNGGYELSEYPYCSHVDWPPNDTGNQPIGWQCDRLGTHWKQLPPERPGHVYIAWLCDIGHEMSLA